MRHTSETKQDVIRYRSEGASIPQIAQKFCLARSTVSLWVRNMVLSQEQKDALAYNHKNILARSVEARRIQRNYRLEEEKRCSLEMIQTLFQQDDHELWQLVAALLFWCEGGKDLGAGIQFANSDPKMIYCFLHALRQGFAIDEGRLRGLIHLHAYHDEQRQTLFWSRITNIPVCRFQGPYIKPNSGRRKQEGYEGCISIRYYDKALAQKLTTLYDAVHHII